MRECKIIFVVARMQLKFLEKILGTNYFNYIWHELSFVLQIVLFQLVLDNLGNKKGAKTKDLVYIGRGGG
jgi:hypothetical protein